MIALSLSVLVETSHSFPFFDVSTPFSKSLTKFEGLPSHMAVCQNQ